MHFLFDIYWIHSSFVTRINYHPYAQFNVIVPNKIESLPELFEVVDTEIYVLFVWFPCNWLIFAGVELFELLELEREGAFNIEVPFKEEIDWLFGASDVKFFELFVVVFELLVIEPSVFHTNL
jgi:hypothetical protein